MWIDVALYMLLYVLWWSWHFMYYDDHGLAGTTWSNMMICVVDLYGVWVYLTTCDYVKVCVILFMLGDHVRLWLWAYECSHRVDA